MQKEKSYPRKIGLNETFHFSCAGCGICCQDNKDVVPLEPIDVFRISKHLNMETAEMMLKYTHSLFMDESGYPVVLLNTAGKEETCVFRKDGKCSIHYGAKPKTCKVYPLSVSLNTDNLLDFEYFLLDENRFHFTGSEHSVKNWTDRYFPEEERRAMLAQADHMLRLSMLLRTKQIDPETLFKMELMYQYILFDMDQDFLSQYKRNVATLEERL